MSTMPLLEVDDLTVEFATRRGIVQAVRGVDLTLAKGETLGIVGESGSGKSVTSYAVMRILDRAGRIVQPVAPASACCFRNAAAPFACPRSCGVSTFVGAGFARSRR